MTGRAGEKRVIILGALSAIAEATARLYAAEGARLLLAGRNAERLERVSGDLKARGGADCIPWPIDLATATDPRGELLGMAAKLGGPVDAVLLFYGVLGDLPLAEHDLTEVRKILTVNFTSAAEWCLVAAELLERQNAGVLMVASSVAGDRGRQSNYVYGAAKAGISTFVTGLAHRLARTDARAVVAKLGYVDTPMTAHVKKIGPLVAQPAAVARRIKAVVEKGGGPVVYIPSFWRWIMLVVRNVPAVIFHKTNL